jgi:hypothetical protein
MELITNSTEYINLVKSLSQPLETNNPSLLREQLSELAAIKYRLSVLHRQSIEVYREQKNKYLMPPEKGTTVLDRETALDSMVRQWELDRGILEDATILCSQLLSLGQSFLNSLNREIQAGLN